MHTQQQQRQQQSGPCTSHRGAPPDTEQMRPSPCCPPGHCCSSSAIHALFHKLTPSTPATPAHKARTHRRSHSAGHTFERPGYLDMAYSSTVPPGSPPADPMDPSSSSYWAFFSVQEQPGGGERSSHSWSGTFERVGHYSDDLAPSGELVGGGGGGCEEAGPWECQISRLSGRRGTGLPRSPLPAPVPPRART